MTHVHRRHQALAPIFQSPQQPVRSFGNIDFDYFDDIIELEGKVGILLAGEVVPGAGVRRSVGMHSCMLSKKNKRARASAALSLRACPCKHSCVCIYRVWDVDAVVWLV